MNVVEVCFSLWINRSINNLFSFCCKSLELNDLEIIGESICLRSLEIIAKDRFETFVGSFSEELFMHIYLFLFLKYCIQFNTALKNSGLFC